MDKEAYKKSVLELRQRLLNTLAVVSIDWPETLDPEHDIAKQGGATGDNWHLHAVAGHLDEILALYGRVQKALGLPMGHEPRYQRCRSCHGIVAPDVAAEPSKGES